LAASRDDEDDKDDNGDTIRQSAQENLSTGEPSTWFSSFPTLPPWLRGNIFTRVPHTTLDYYRADGSGTVSPATRPYRSIETHGMESLELTDNPTHGSMAGDTHDTDLYGASIRGSLSVPRKPVPPSRSSISEQELGDSTEQLIPPVEAIMTPTTPRSHSLAGSSTPTPSPRSSNTLLPPEMLGYTTSSSASSSQPAAIVDEQDLHTHDTMRSKVWTRQLTPQSPPTVFSPAVYDPNSRQAESDLGSGVQSQKLRKSQESATGLRNEFERDGDILKGKLHATSDNDFVDEVME
jgi:hypothetical protein